MRKSFIKNHAPVLTGAVQEETADTAIRAIKNFALRGAKGNDLHLTKMHKDCLTIASLKRIISESPLPIFALDYTVTNTEKEENERLERLLCAWKAGASGIDKAKEENLLQNSEYQNWTIVRPATTYSTGRFQLVTLEAPTVIHRMQSGKTIVLPKSAMECQATLSWGGDVGVMIARILFNEKALGESYNVATAEHHSWHEIAEMYHQIIPFQYITVSTDDYLDIIAEGAGWAKYQLIYARMFQRITDNSKILSLTGMKQSDLMPLEKGLRFEYENSKNIDFSIYATDYRNVRMDEYLKKHGFWEE